MTITNDLWNRHLNHTEAVFHTPTVLFTTEAESMVQEQRAWVNSNGPDRLPHKFDFVTNEKDMLPGSGFMKDVRK